MASIRIMPKAINKFKFLTPNINLAFLQLR